MHRVLRSLGLVPHDLGHPVSMKRTRRATTTARSCWQLLRSRIRIPPIPDGLPAICTGGLLMLLAAAPAPLHPQAAGLSGANPCQSAREGQPNQAVTCGLLRGRITATSGERSPEGLTVRFQAASKHLAGGTTSDESHTSSCQLHRSRFQCALPVGVYDLVLEVPGYAPIYSWNVSITASTPNDIGTRRLFAGASITGWVVRSTGVMGSLPTAHLEPLVSGWYGDPRNGQRIELRSRTQRVDQHGFFQFGGLAPGSYRLQVRAQDGSIGEIPLPRLKRAESRALAQPLSLLPPPKLELFLEPALAPSDVLWHVAVARAEPGESNLFSTVAEGEADLAGYFVADGLSPGKYSVSITDGEGSRWLRKEVEVQPQIGPLTLRVPYVRIAGRVTRGGEGLEAKLFFGTTQGEREIRLQSDATGRFEGALPHAGNWPLEIELPDSRGTIQALPTIHVDDPQGSRPTHLEIRVPDTLVEGAAMHGGRPVPHAQVLALRVGESFRREAMLRADDDGNFRLEGLEPGVIQLQGRAPGLQGDWIPITLIEGRDAPRVTLELYAVRTLRGRLIGSNGPVAGARLTVLAAGRGLAVSRTTETRADGSFEFRLREDTPSLNAIIAVPGIGWEIKRIAVPEAPQEAIVSFQGGSGDLDLQGMAGRSRQVSGVLVHNGARLYLSALSSILFPVGMMRFGPGGSIQLLGAAAGPYQYCADPAVATPCTTGEVFPGASTHFTAPLKQPRTTQRKDRV